MIEVGRITFLLAWPCVIAASSSHASSWLRLGRSKQETSNDARNARFPSVAQRVKLYMGNWYLPPCNVETGAIRFEKINSTSLRIQLPSYLTETNDTDATRHDILNAVDVDRIFFLEHSIISECANSQNEIDTSHMVESRGLSQAHSAATEKAKFKAKKKDLIIKSMRLYCADAKSSLVPVLEHVTSELEAHKPYPPLLVQFGDLLHSHVYRFLPVPHFKKFRSAVASKEGLAPSTRNRKHDRHCLDSRRPNLVTVNGADHMQPIIWKLGTARHYGTIPMVEKSDTPWESKKPVAVYRGQLTGSIHSHQRHSSDDDNCNRWHRCRLVYTHGNSTLVDAKLTSTRHRMPNVLNGVELVGKSLPMAKMLEYKAIVMLEGNDVASGLKWALLSQSVVLMPPPKFTSWAMEYAL